MEEDPLFIRNPKTNLTGDDQLFVLNPKFDSPENRRAYGVSSPETELSQQMSQQLQIYSSPPVQPTQATLNYDAERVTQGVWTPAYDETPGPQQVISGIKPCVVYKSSADSYHGLPGSNYGETAMMTDWMRCLPNNAPLGALSIPGTHDSMATSGGPVTQRHSWDIATQLKAGIRYFDLRLFLTPTDIVYSNGPGLPAGSIHEFFQPVTQFLKEHPLEMVLVRIKDMTAANAQFYNRLHTLLNEQYAAFILPLQTPNVLLGQARGKIVIVKDYYGGPAGGVEFSQLDFTESLPVRSPELKNIKPLTNIVKAHLKKAMKSSDLTKIFITDTSAMGTGFPYQYAAVVNEKILFFLYNNQKGRLGIVAVDFPSEHLIYSIVQRNFGRVCKGINK